MKKYILVCYVVLSALLLISWGFTGHRTIALIAERHLTPQAKAAVADLLGSESMADVSTWADQVRNQDQYKHTAGWHFVNLPLGLSKDGFLKQVYTMEKDNVYSAVRRAQQNLMNPTLSKTERIESLKFLIHLVGDLHQPMHVSRAEDKGGNTVQLNFEGKGTNLHSLWDSRLLDKKGLSEAQLVNEYNKASPATVAKWQKTPMVDWIWESYQASSKLYAEVDAMKSRAIGEDYYKSHIAIVDQRIAQAGIRLAAMLNGIYKGKGPYDGNLLAPPSQEDIPIKGSVNEALKGVPTVKANDDGTITKVLESNVTQGIVQSINLKDVAGFVGKTVRVTGKVYGSRDMSSFYLVNLGAAYPNQTLTVVLKGEAKKLASNIDGKTITVSGKVTEYKGKPQIEVFDSNLVRL